MSCRCLALGALELNVVTTVVVVVVFSGVVGGKAGRIGVGKVGSCRPAR